MARFLLRASAGVALAAMCAASTPAATADDPARAAFVAAYGQAAPLTRSVVRPAKPPGCECTGAATRVSLTVAPHALVDLGSGRWALIAYETQTSAAHSEPGAIAIAYLRRGADGWRLERRWDELAWTGDSGAPADATRTLARAGAPTLLFARRSDVHQGMHTDTAWAFALGASAPRLVGAFPIGGRLDADACDDCGHYAYDGAIEPARSSASLFGVAYAGWRKGPADLRRTDFTTIAGYAVGGGKLAPVGGVVLPDCGGSCAYAGGAGGRYP